MENNNTMRCGITPAYINELKDNEVFVFGSNLRGMHGGGAARVARLKFGAVMGQGVGLQGRSYAIPTMQGGVETIRPYTDEFIAFAKAHPDLHFLVTRIGCGIAGFSDEEIAPLFREALGLANVSLPKEFIDVLAKAGTGKDNLTVDGILLGAIAGDVIGSYYEFLPAYRYDFNLFNGDSSRFTDDTVMTVANADWLLTGDSLLGIMQDYGNRYINAGYGGMFYNWLREDDPKPYNSFGNGSAMRVSPVGWASGTLEETLAAAKQSAEVTHNHPEGIKGAQAVAASIYLARTGKSKREIRQYVETAFGYDLGRTCSEIRETYRFDETCQGSVPESIIAFLESTDYENAVRLAVSLNGDADTMGAITGGIAEAFYGEIPQYIKEEVLKRLPGEFIDVMSRFYKKYVG